MSVYTNLHIPDMDIRAFTPRGGRILAFKSPAAAPAAPDYTAAAKATAQGNLQNAQYATEANRPNMRTPWGTSTWTSTPTYDMTGYNAALAKYNAAPQSSPVQYTSNEWGGAGVPMANSGGSASAGVAPNLADYITGQSWSNNVTLSPQQQALFDQSNKIQQGLFGAQDNALSSVNRAMSSPMATAFDPSSITMGTPLDMSKMVYGQVYDPTKATNNATDLILQRINPQLDRQQTSLQTQLANQGVAQGSDAWNNAIESFGRTRNDAQNQAALTGIDLGMRQQGQTYGQQDTNLARYLQGQAQNFGQTNANAQLAAALQNQQFTQQNYLRDLPLNELNALRAGNQVSAPQFQSFATQQYTPGPDYLGATNANYQAALGNSNAQNAANNSMMSGLFGLGTAGLLAPAGTFGGLFGAGAGAAAAGSPAAAAALFSDRRLKTDIRKVGTADNGLGIYSYRYKWGGPTMIGYMADEVESVAPHAVGSAGGFKTVDYSRV